MSKQKSNRRWSARIIVRYLLFQLPEFGLFAAVMLVLQRYGLVSVSLAWSLIGLWVLKDAVLYPFLWQSYEGKRSDDFNPLIGAIAIAQQRLDPDGYVRIRGERLKAELMPGCRPVEKGGKVRVCAVRGLILSVEPQSDNDPESCEAL